MSDEEKSEACGQCDLCHAEAQARQEVEARRLLLVLTALGFDPDSVIEILGVAAGIVMTEEALAYPDDAIELRKLFERAHGHGSELAAMEAPEGQVDELTAALEEQPPPESLN